MAISKRLRYEILRRDGFACQYCGAGAPDATLTVDHVTPKALGGTDDPANLLTACEDCNAGKSSSNPDAPLVEAADRRAAQWKQAMETVIAQRQAVHSELMQRVKKFGDTWGDVPKEVGWRASVERFLAAGLTDEFLAAAASRAMLKERLPDRDVWRYFCGICWRELDAIQEATASIVHPRSSGLQQDDLRPFDHMSVVYDFVEQLLDALHLPDQVRRPIVRAYWEGIPLAAKAWDAAQHLPPQPLPPDEEIDPRPHDMAVEAMSEYALTAVTRAWQWRCMVDENDGS